MRNIEAVLCQPSAILLETSAYAPTADIELDDEGCPETFKNGN